MLSRSRSARCDGPDAEALALAGGVTCLRSRRVLVRPEEGQLKRPHWLRPVRAFFSLPATACRGESGPGSAPSSVRAPVSPTLRLFDIVCDACQVASQSR